MRVTPLVVVLGSLAAIWSGPARAQSAPTATAAASTAPAPAATSTLSADGLTPPPAVDAAPSTAPNAPNSASTEAALERADREDSGRGLEFVWLNAEFGVTDIGLATFSKGHLFDPVDVRSNETGVVAGVGAGVRLVFATLGARFRDAPMPDYHLWSLALEGGLHAPLGAFEPYGTFGFGYASLNVVNGSPDVGAYGRSAKGFDARVSVGADYYLTPMFSLGLDVSAELLSLNRTARACPAVPLGAPNGASPAYCGSGGTTGGAVTASAVAGLHF